MSDDGAGVAELANAGHSQRPGRKPVWVRLPPPAPWHLTRRTGRAHTALALRVLCVADHRHARRGREFSRGPIERPSAPICPGLPVSQRRVAEEPASQLLASLQSDPLVFGSSLASAEFP